MPRKRKGGNHIRINKKKKIVSIQNKDFPVKRLTIDESGSPVSEIGGYLSSKKLCRQQ